MELPGVISEGGTLKEASASMKSVTVVLVVMAALTAALPDKPYYDVDDKDKCWQLFETFIADYNKQYFSEAEKNKRFEIFLQNLENINELNRKTQISVHAIHKYADLTYEEFFYRHTGFVKRPVNLIKNVTDLTYLSHEGLPDNFDWRDEGVVSRAKNQRHCLSCWAFSVIANIESQYAIKHHKILDLSEQQLVACDHKDEACHGGLIQVALEQTVGWGGQIELEQDYPYNADQLTDDENRICLADKSKAAVHVTDYHFYDLTTISEDQLKALLYENGPISIAIDAQNLPSHFDGIYEICGYSEIDHAVLLVGYGEEGGVPYWTIKNSWGEDWGKDGFIRILRGKNCLNLMNEDAGSAIVE